MDEWEKYELHHRARLAIKPGLTGMWQVSGRSEITDFEEVVKLDTKYISEWSFLIEYTNSVLDTTNAYICNSRPRRFGKSYAANMLAAYYSKGADSGQMFSGLKISKDADFRKHLNKYDVLHIDIQWFLANCEDADKVVSFITKSVLDELRDIYPEVLSQDVVTFPDALSRVKECTG